MLRAMDDVVEALHSRKDLHRYLTNYAKSRGIMLLKVLLCMRVSAYMIVAVERAA